MSLRDLKPPLCPDVLSNIILMSPGTNKTSKTIAQLGNILIYIIGVEYYENKIKCNEVEY
jgi:hypothetical protein